MKRSNGSQPPASEWRAGSVAAVRRPPPIHCRPLAPLRLLRHRRIVGMPLRSPVLSCSSPAPRAGSVAPSRSNWRTAASTSPCTTGHSASEAEASAATCARSRARRVFCRRPGRRGRLSRTGADGGAPPGPHRCGGQQRVAFSNTTAPRPFLCGVWKVHWRANTAPAIVLANALAAHLKGWQRNPGSTNQSLVWVTRQTANRTYNSPITLSKAALDAATTLLAQPWRRVAGGGVAPGVTLVSGRR